MCNILYTKQYKCQPFFGPPSFLSEIAYPPFLHCAKQVLPRRKVFFQLILYGEFPSRVSIFP